MPRLKSEILDETIHDFKKAREHVPQRSRNVLDNLTTAGDVASSFLKIAEAGLELRSYYKERKAINGKK